jgi:hypothetical protein
VADAEVLDQLTEIYMDAPDAQAVSDASNEIDAKLGMDPLGQGIEAGTERILVIPPLGVVFEVTPADRLVTIKEYYYMG